MKKISVVVLLALLTFSGCISFLNGPRKTLAEMEFEGAHFGLEYIPDPSLEGYNETYYVFYQPKEMEDRKYILKPEDGFQLSYYPADPATLKGVHVEVIDTVKRTFDRKGPKELFTTLYVDPKVFDQQAFDCFEKFVKTSYKNPDEKNPFLLWLNKPYNVVDKPDTLHFLETVYAIVYSSLDDLEPQYISGDGKVKLKVCVDKSVEIVQTGQPNAWLGAGIIRDSVFNYYDQYAKGINAFGEFKGKNGKFKSWYNQTVQLP